MMKNLLNKAKSTQNSNTNTTIKVELKNNRNQVMEESLTDTIDQYSVYLDERNACNKVRLTLQLSLMASNVLFNHITEITKNDDTDKCECLNFKPVAVKSSYGKGSDFVWGEEITDCIRDTQLTSPSDDDKNYTYHPGIDIFNNHILRSSNLYPNYYDSSQIIGNEFNTIFDYIRDGNGRKKSSCIYSKHGFSDISYLHMYRKSDTLTYAESIADNLKDKNGWLGFLNKSKMPSLTKQGKDIGISKILNNEGTNKFIEMYPDNTCYQLLPYYNRKRHRKEKNWEYVLTYPYSSTTQGISCINSKLNTLKIAMIDEEEEDTNGLERTIIYCTCKHGLNADDTINIYKSRSDNSEDELFESNVNVDYVIDEYTFAVYLGENICSEWVSVLDDKALDYYFDHYDKEENRYYKDDGTWISSFNMKINADFDDVNHIGSQNLSFARVVNNEECEYYVRIFSKFPNLSYMDGDINEETVNKEYSGLGHTAAVEFAKDKYGFQSIESKLAYAKNAYNDNVVQIVFNDDICFDYVHDNLKRPISSLYLSLFKTNYGHKEWYNGDVTNTNIEHSHAFGKLTCGLEYSPYTYKEEFMSGNTTYMNNVNGKYCGLSQLLLRPHIDGYDDDEIVFSEQDLFYGDLCEYSKSNCNERTIQSIYNRFNTQQRELKNSGLKMESAFTSVKYDNIVYDDYDTVSDFMINTFTFNDTPTEEKEGYIYKMSYEIPIRAWSLSVNEITPTSMKIAYINDLGDGTYKITTLEDSHISKDYNLYLYNQTSYESYECVIDEILSSNEIKVHLKDHNGVSIVLDTPISANKYKLIDKPDLVPTYGCLMSDGSAKFKWRKLYQNGFEATSGLIEEYPFANNSLYVNRLFNIYVKRQDPFGNFGLSSPSLKAVTVLNGTLISNTEEETLTENDASC